MHGHIRLGYLVLDVRRLAPWQQFAERVLGLTPRGAGADGSLAYSPGASTYRLYLQPGSADDLAGVGWEIPDEDGWAETVARLRRAGAAVLPADERLRAARGAARLCRFADPEGNGIEVALREPGSAAPEAASGTFSFLNDDTGFGHVVLAVRKVEAMTGFYMDTLGFAVTERLAARVGPIDVRGVFLHCNRRHHSLALMALPQPKRLHHFMLELASVTEVARAAERARALKVPFSLGLGQHPDPDGTVSFYGRTPSGFDFELGAGGRQIDPRAWRASEQHVTSAWGHRPTLGLRLRALRDLACARLGLARRAHGDAGSGTVRIGAADA